jgi:D-cysteine desulfhydrase
MVDETALPNSRDGDQAPLLGGGVCIERPIFDWIPGLTDVVSFAGLGQFPTPVQALGAPRLEALGIYLKRDDLSSPVYGGNKVRTLEALFGQALRLGQTSVVSTGAFGSNHAVATVLHAPRVGLRASALLCPQPPSLTAASNFEVTACFADEWRGVRHWSLLPLGIWRWRSRAGTRSMVMPPGGANPLGALGYVSAALELANQVNDGVMPTPDRIVLPVGSTCTSAGLLVGLRVARAAGLAFISKIPQVYAIRVTPWPVTSPWRVVSLARRTSLWLTSVTGDRRWDFSAGELSSGLRVDRRFLGAGYGRATEGGRRAMSSLEEFGSLLDTTYSAKAAAGLLRSAEEAPGTHLFWATKSSAQLPSIDPAALSRLPDYAQRWLVRARHS